MRSENRPGPLTYIAYCYGKVLPPHYNDWVRRDLAGRGARLRTLVRVSIPAIIIVAPLWLIPATAAMHLAMSTLLLLPFVYFAHALDTVWRMHRLRQHGLDPEAADERTRLREAHIREDYERRYGRRSD